MLRWRILFDVLLSLAMLMPHCHSLAARRIRTQRAICLGLVQPHPRSPTLIEVATPVAKWAREVASTFETHRQFEALNGAHHHNAGLALLAARDKLDKSERQSAHGVIVQGNSARHDASADCSDGMDDWEAGCAPPAPPLVEGMLPWGFSARRVACTS
jgi:hypothetical protein